MKGTVPIVRWMARGRAALAAALILGAFATLRAGDESGSQRVDFVDAREMDVRVARVRQLGDTAIRWLGAKMVQELRLALQSGGPEGALDVAHLRSVSKEGQAIPGMPSVTGFKLLGVRLMNAANAPDAAEQLAFERVRAAIAAGNAPNDTILQRVTDPNGRVEWRAYRVLALQTTCRACHGDAAAQSPALRQRLLDRFPHHAAIGFRTGEWRGLIRVSLANPPEG